MQDFYLHSNTVFLHNTALYARAFINKLYKT